MTDIQDVILFIVGILTLIVCLSYFLCYVVVAQFRTTTHTIVGCLAISTFIQAVCCCASVVISNDYDMKCLFVSMPLQLSLSSSAAWATCFSYYLFHKSLLPNIQFPPKLWRYSICCGWIYPITVVAVSLICASVYANKLVYSFLGTCLWGGTCSNQVMSSYSWAVYLIPLCICLLISLTMQLAALSHQHTLKNQLEGHMTPIDQAIELRLLLTRGHYVPRIFLFTRGPEPIVAILQFFASFQCEQLQYILLGLSTLQGMFSCGLFLLCPPTDYSSHEPYENIYRRALPVQFLSSNTVFQSDEISTIPLISTSSRS
eukprot:NODE_5258_length_1041_cov_23.176471_g4696_i0.p1 GENE.NODE_5258_length_1041_cov_23.176471_g4696_i0~~NODE_5258_length_1041_cov_23.176471_g4696_i0.p1  ORF type:complete len:332 (-),score=28.98 NODE_5258_length_1041_cov_23.176471_g4696_i0:46-993(-)